MRSIISFPHMGNTWIAGKALFEYMNLNCLVPPLTSKRTEQLGVKYAPPDACYPYKLTLGNMIEALEQGATIIAMLGGNRGMCRLGYYPRLQEITLKKLGYKFKIICVGSGIKNMALDFKRINPRLTKAKAIRAFFLAVQKLRTVAHIERLARHFRAYEEEKGQTTKVETRVLQELDQAKGLKEINNVKKNIIRAFNEIQIDHSKEILKIGMLGEVFCVLDSFANRDIERKLGEQGVLVSQKMSVARWLIVSARLDFLRWWTGHIVARHYLKTSGGGEDQQSTGKALIYAKHGYDGVILIQPRTCMPENIAQMFLPDISKKYSMPFLALSFDENTSEHAVNNRLEAFVEMLKRKKLKTQK